MDSNRIDNQVSRRVIDAAQAFNAALYDAALVGLKVVVVGTEEKIFESPYSLPFQRVTVWRDESRLAEITIYEDHDAMVADVLGPHAAAVEAERRGSSRHADAS